MHGYNLYMYCGNNPANRIDRGGKDSDPLDDAVEDFVEARTLESGGTPNAPIHSGTGTSYHYGVDLSIASNSSSWSSGIASNGYISYSYTSIENTSTSGVCFVAGTKVLTESGYINIEDVVQGSLVYSYNTGTGEVELKEVVHTFEKMTEDLVCIWVDGVKITTTPEHPFYVDGIGWTSASKLQVGDMLLQANGGIVAVEMVQQKTEKEPVRVYNFEVEDFHTYFVSEFSILVHNECAAAYFDGNQQAVLDLAREYKMGIPLDEAEILVGWAEEYGISSHPPMVHANRSGIWATTLHIKIKNYHVRVLN